MINKTTRCYLFLLILVSVLTGCASTGNNSYSSKNSGFTNISTERAVPPINMEIIIPVFDGGIEKDDSGKIVDEIKRAEAIYFATKIKRHIEDRKYFVNPKVMPSDRAVGDIYLYGSILESNGLELKLKINAEDSTGNKLYTKTYYKKCDKECSSQIKGSPRFSNFDRFEHSIYRQVAIDLEKAIQKKRYKDLVRIRKTSDLRFARDMAPDKFNHYLKTSKNSRSTSGERHKLISEPDGFDPMYLRVKAVRAKEQMFIDDSQIYIDDFVNNKDFISTYNKWQDRSAKAISAQKEAQRAKTSATFGAIFGVALALYGASEGNSDVAVGGAYVADQSIKNAKKFEEEAKMWEEEIRESNIDINKEIAPRNIEIENIVFELRGSISEQFDTYREYLRSIYLQETAPLENNFKYSIN